MNIYLFFFFMNIFILPGIGLNSYAMLNRFELENGIELFKCWICQNIMLNKSLITLNMSIIRWIDSF